MRVKMKTTYAGPAGTAGAGQTIDLDKDDAYALIEGGYAEQVEEDKPKAKRKTKAKKSKPAKSETATAPAGETTSTRKPRPIPVSGA